MLFRTILLRPFSILSLPLTALSLLLLSGSELVSAQPIVPANDGTGTIVSPDGNTFNIGGGSLSADQANLFHSFQQFGLNPDQIANFLSQPHIRNILGRVVGGDPSIIQGLIRVSGGTSNLYLMNPAGIVFGPTAQLDVPANFAATTATSIQFDREFLNAIGSNNYSALSGDPNAYVFSSQTGDIINAGELKLEPGKVLTLIANTVTNTGEISSEGGQVVLASMPEPGVVRLSQPGQVLSVEYQVGDSTPVPTDEPISVADLSELLNTSQDYDLGFTLNPDGSVQLNVSPLKIAPNPGTTIASGTIDVSGAAGGNVSVLGETVAVVGANIDASGANGGGVVHIGGELQGQGTTPTAQRTVVDSTSVIRVDAVDQGNGGEAIVWADGRTDFAGTITAKGGANGGDGGFVEVSGKESLGFTGTVDTTAINGATGTLLLDPTDILIVDGSFGSGDSEFSTLGGTVSSTYTPSSEPFTISELTIESFLLSSDVSLAATNNITIADLTDNFLGFSSGSGNLTLTADADNSGAGSVIMDSSDTIAIGGSINISGASLNLGGLSTDGSDIQLTSTNGDITLTNQINTSRFSLNAGNITIESSGTIDASGESSFTLNNDVNNLGEEYTLNTSSDNGVGGNVTLTAVGDITLGLIDTSGSLGGGNISMNSTGGNVNAIVSSVPVSVESATGTANVGILDSSSDQGDGGTVNLRAAGNVTVGSILSGSIDGAGGDVTLSSSTGGVTAISTGTLTSSSGVSETSSAGGIATGTTGSGQGGNITITAPGDIRTGWLLTGNIGSSGLQGGGNVRLTSTGGSIDTTINVTDIDAGLLVDLGLTSAQATLASQAGTELGMIITGSQDGNGGTVNLSAAGDIRTGAIVSGSQNATGGTVTLTSSGGSIDTSNDAFFSGLTEQAWLEGASAAGLEPTDTIDFAQDLGFGTGVYTVGELATILDGFSFRLGIITGSENGTGADVTLQAAGNVTTSNILTTSLDGNSGNISITSSGGAINGQEGVLLSGVNADLLQSLGLGADLSTVLGYLSDPDVAFGGYITLSLNGNAGNITLNAAGDVLTNYLATSSFSGRPGNITINSGGNVVVGRLLSNIANGIFPAEFSNLTDDRADQLADLISRGVLNSSGATSGGNIDIQATTSITTGAVNSSSTLGSGGSVFLDPEGDIEVYSINAQGGTQLGSSSSGVSGGDVTIVTQSNFRALGSFTDQNGIDASISTAAPGQIVFSESESGSSTLQPGNGGRISISHGGNGTTPFTIGRALSSGSGNGVVGAITSGNFTIFPYNIDPTTAASLANGNPFLIAPESGYFFTERFPLDGFDNAIGSIGIFSVDRPNVICEGGGCEPPPKTCDELGICGQPGGGISEDGQVLSIDEARDILALIEQRSGVKPALIYVSFEAPDFILQRQAAAVEFERDEARFSEQYEQHLNVPDRFQGSPLQIAPSDRDILQLLVVTSSEEPFLVSVPDATRERVLFNGGRMIDAIIDQEPEGVYLRSSQQLYSQLVAPISAALEEREVENLVFIMDNSLRLLPVAALHDGEQYLIEKYSVGLMPSLSLTDTRFVDIKEVGLLAMGADTFSDEAPLPSVPTELSVISELWNAPEPLLNNRFTLENLRSARSNQRYGILHLATHGDFNPGAANQSYIRFGDRRVTLDQLRTLRLYDPTVELMVLSACRTAVGNPDAELGFAGLAHQAGVKTALGSLWYVGDQATLGLMTSFYDSLRTAPIKAEALRQAQLAMLRGEINLKDGAINIENSDAPALQFPLRGEVIEALEALPVDLRHPYAWSAFTMIGSPW